MLNQDDILNALRDCYDSSHEFRKPVNVVDLGLIEGVSLTADRDAPGAGIPSVPQRLIVTVTLVAPSEDEAAQAQLAALIANRLAGLPEVWRTNVHFDTEQQWTPSRIKPGARQFLGLDFPILNNKR